MNNHKHFLAFFFLLISIVPIACLSSTFIAPPKAELRPLSPRCDILDQLNNRPQTLTESSLPTDLEVISPQNANRLELLARWGIGKTTDIDWSPDGNFLAITTAYKIYLYETQTFSLTKTISTGQMEPIILTTISSDNKFIVTAKYSGILEIWSREDGSRIHEFLTSNTITEFSMSQDGKLIATANGVVDVTIVNVDTGDSFTLNADSASQVAFSPDNRLLINLSCYLQKLKLTASRNKTTLSSNPAGVTA